METSQQNTKMSHLQHMAS